MKVFCAVSTHWDREWYRPFQGFRYNLVKVTDQIMEALEKNEIDVFTFDGQTIVLEDYLEIKPKNRERLVQLIKSGKLKIGPWYVMPDELLVSGESIIRNFLTGKHVADEFGADVWKYGYMNDIFGHIAQMPQILNGFGIKCTYLGRGLGSSEQNFKNFIWRSPDGSECYGYKECYANFANEFKKAVDKEWLVKDFISRNEDNTEAVILLYTYDHAGVDENMLQFAKLKRRLSECYEVIDGLEGISEALVNYEDSLPIQTGELITTGQTQEDFRAVTHSISSYYPIKYENDICEQLLENKVSPMLVMAKCMGIEVDPAFYQLACKYLLKNQPHDSICGCSSDVVHEDMLYRYSQVKSIASAIETDIKDRLSHSGGNGYSIAVMNYDVKKYQGVFVTELSFDENWPNKIKDNARYQEYCDFDILDEKGSRVPYQIIDIEKNYCDCNRPYIPGSDKYKVAVLGELNAFGQTVFKIVPQKPVCCAKTYSDGELSAENKYIKLELSNDGSVSIFDKENGKLYQGLNTFLDDGEIGNGWFSERPLGLNTMVSSKGAKTSIEVVRRGELISTFRVKKALTVPAYTDYHTLKRAEQSTELLIITDITLKKDSKVVEFETTVDNCACDHRLRVEFPTDMEGDSYYTSQAFTFLKRHRGVTEAGANFVEPEPYEKNTGGVICVKNQKCGLSFISKAGIHEGGVSNSGVISATMLRSFGRFMYGNLLNEKAQLKGKHTFYYALTPETDFSKLNDIKKSLFEIYPNVNTEEDKQSSSLFEVIGDVSVSIVKPAEDGKGFILRLFNTKEAAAKGTVILKINVKKAFKVNLAEEKLSELDVKDNKLDIEILSNKIETIYMIV